MDIMVPSNYPCGRNHDLSLAKVTAKLNETERRDISHPVNDKEIENAIKFAKPP